MRQWNRRRILQAALAGGGATLLAARAAWTQAPSRTLQPGPRLPGQPASEAAVLGAPRRALVIGNGAYALGALRNPGNDARDVAAQLERHGFEVTLGIDLGREEMLRRIGAYGDALARVKPVALFYFAGHGLQFGWRNYLLPVDARIERVEDVRSRCVDVNALIEGMAGAANPMNLLILDACRDNPFGREVRLAQQGLSQVDAPPGTLLAYATSPGNVASDGEGENSLYTEHLLQEMRVPEAKIEDVFKRVRLGVRRRSNGRQIPWESTSLEQDFWFIPPKQLVAPETDYEEELAAWERVAAGHDIGALVAFLRRYPSGPFSELAQLRLDALLAAQGEKPVQPATAPENPFSAGAARADTAFAIGDSYVYARLDRETREPLGRIASTVVRITDTEVIFDSGLILDRLGNTIQLPDGRRFTPRQDQQVEYAVGKKWTTRFAVVNRQGMGAQSHFNFKVTGRERISVSAGAFDCFVVEGEGYAITEAGFRIQLANRRWMAPERVRRPIALEQFRRMDGRAGGLAMPPFRKPKPPAMKGGGPLNNERLELVSFRQA